MDITQKLQRAGVTPQRATETLRRLGITTVINTREKGYEMRGAAWWDETTRICTGIHITDDPRNVIRKLRAGRDPDYAAPEARVQQELGPGLYVSAVPQLWMGRSTGKWLFLTRLTEAERETLANAVVARVNEQHSQRYVSDREAQTMLRDLGYAKSTPGVTHPFVQAAGQPFNIKVWSKEFLSPLGIEASGEPQEVEVEFQGTFAEFSGGYLPEQAYRILRYLGADGAYIRNGFSAVAQTVIWTRSAIVRFGDYKP